MVKVVLKKLPDIITNWLQRLLLLLNLQGKGKELHKKMIHAEGSLTEEIIMQMAQEVGLNVGAIKNRYSLQRPLKKKLHKT